jgi:tripartite-type tricarboxylate transporter receptor subunit TctC
MALLAGGAPLAAAEDYPTHNVTIIVPFTPAGSTDLLARMAAQAWEQRLGKSFVVENRPGAGQQIGVNMVAKAAPDGYTLLLMVTGAGLPENPGYDIAKDFAPIGLIASVPIVIMANAAVPVKSLADVIALAKKDGDKVTVGTPPAPTLNYFGAEQFKSMTGTKITIVSYKGTGPLTNDLVGGHVMLAFNTLPPAIGNIQAGKLRAIAVGSPTRMAAIPDVPTIAEAGLPGLEIVQYYGLVAPAGTPQPIIERLNKELAKILKSDDMKKRLLDAGGDPVISSPAEYAQNIQREEGKWQAVIKKLGLVIKY